MSRESIRHATIKDVALTAQVSPTTVSNFLNGRTIRMSATTHQRIEQAINRLNYRPSRAARDLRTGNSGTIGLVVPSVANPFWGHWAQVLEAEAMQHGLQVLLCNTARSIERESASVDDLRSAGVRAIVLCSSLPSLVHVEPAIRSGLTVLAFDRESQSNDDSGVLNLSVDNFTGAHMAVKHLLSLGHCRIGFISGSINTVSRRRRLAGYQSALAEYGIPFNDDLVWVDTDKGFGDSDAADLGRRGMMQLLDLPSPPTAILAINDMYAFGACAGLHEIGKSAPQVSVVGFDDVILAPLYNPPLTTIRQPLAKMADIAVQTILRMPNGTRKQIPRSVLVQPTLVVRDSTAPPYEQSQEDGKDYVYIQG